MSNDDAIRVLEVLDSWLAAVGIPWRFDSEEPFFAFVFVLAVMIVGVHLCMTVLEKLGIAGRAEHPEYKTRRVSQRWLEPANEGDAGVSTSQNQITTRPPKH